MTLHDGAVVAGDIAAVTALIERASAGHRRSIGRLLSIVERGGATADALDALARPRDPGAFVVGITGAPGAGKSTLTGALSTTLAASGRRVGVVAIDPSSPVTGGAILGDRIRMDDVVASAHANVFIRSMATRGHHGGLSLAVPGALRILSAVGFDVVIVETAGVGQIEIDIVGQADSTVVVLNPGWGDAVQANKAGVMEIADIFVVNKADRPGVDDTVRDIEYMLDLGHKGVDCWRPPIVRCVALEATGIEQLVAAIDAHRVDLIERNELARRRTERLDAEVRTRLQQLVNARLEAAMAADPEVIAELHAHRATPADAARTLANRLLR